jgi:hypothetical protein
MLLVTRYRHRPTEGDIDAVVSREQPQAHSASVD